MKKDTPIFYITNDPWRGLGLEGVYENYHIVSTDNPPITDWLLKKGVKVFSLARELDDPNPIYRNTRRLLLHPRVQEYIMNNSSDEVGIVFFKPQFDPILALKDSLLAKERVVISLNPTTRVSKLLENKLEFARLCKEKNIRMPASQEMLLDSIDFKTVNSEFDALFVIQFETGWFGNRTFFIHSEQELLSLQNTFTDRMVKVARFIEGNVLTNNIVVGKKHIFQSYPFLQITEVDNDKHTRLARNPGSTIGNSWCDLSTVFGNRTSAVVSSVQQLTEKVGIMARENGFLGYAGLDFIVGIDGTVYVQEMNARFTASTPMLTQLERREHKVTLLDQHYRELGATLDIPLATPKKMFVPFEGSRIVARSTQRSLMIIDHLPQNGVYYVNAAELLPVRVDFELTDLQEGEFLISSVQQGRRVNLDQEILHLQSLNNNYETLIQKAKEIKETITTA